MKFKVIGPVAALVITIGSAVLVYGNQNNNKDHALANMNSEENSDSLSEPSLANHNLSTAISHENKSADTDNDSATIMPTDDMYITEPELKDRLNEIRKRRPELDLSLAQLKALINKPDAWQADSSIASKLGNKLKPGDAEDGRVFIRFDPVKIETLVPNDRLEMPIPHMNDTFTMVVEEVDSDDPDITVWRGKLEDFDSINRVNIIQGHENGKTVSHIGINTPEGFYVTDVFDDKGWIVPGGTLTNKGGEVIIPIDENGIAGEPEQHGLN